MKQKISQVVTIVFFLLLVFGLSIASLLKEPTEFSENENRQLAQKPKFSKASLISGKYGKDFETYITDQFIGRDSWITWKTRTELALQKKEINGVYFGDDGYLFDKIIQSDFDKEQMQKNIQRVGKLADKYSKILGKDRVKVMIVPTAPYILQDKLPKYAPNYNQDLILDQVAKQVSGSSYINSKDVLQAHKDEYIYYRTDHHWTSLGAYYAYEEWAKSSGFTPFSQTDFRIEEATDEFLGTMYSKVNIKTSKDLIYLYQPKKNMNYQLEYNLGEKQSNTLYDKKQLEGKDKYAVFLGGNNPLVQIKTNNKNGRKLLLIKDSYAHTIAPFIVNHFEQTDMIDFRYYNTGVSDYVEENGITDILYLYNAVNFAKDTNTSKLLK